jgi:hypothetical protein
LRNTTPSEMWGVIMFAIKISSQSGDLLAIARTRRQRSQTHIYRSPLSLTACPVLQDCCKHMVMIRHQCILHYSRKVLDENMTENSALEKNTFNMLFHLQPPSAKAWPFWRTAEITQSTSSSLLATAASLFFCTEQTVMSQQMSGWSFSNRCKNHLNFPHQEVQRIISSPTSDHLHFCRADKLTQLKHIDNLHYFP